MKNNVIVSIVMLIVVVAIAYYAFYLGFNNRDTMIPKERRERLAASVSRVIDDFYEYKRKSEEFMNNDEQNLNVVAEDKNDEQKPNDVVENKNDEQKSEEDVKFKYKKMNQTQIAAQGDHEGVVVNAKSRYIKLKPNEKKEFSLKDVFGSKDRQRIEIFVDSKECSDKLDVSFKEKSDWDSPVILILNAKNAEGNCRVSVTAKDLFGACTATYVLNVLVTNNDKIAINGTIEPFLFKEGEAKIETRSLNGLVSNANIRFKCFAEPDDNVIIPSIENQTLSVKYAGINNNKNHVVILKVSDDSIEELRKYLPTGNLEMRLPVQIQKKPRMITFKEAFNDLLIDDGGVFVDSEIKRPEDVIKYYKKRCASNLDFVKALKFALDKKYYSDDKPPVEFTYHSPVNRIKDYIPVIKKYGAYEGCTVESMENSIAHIEAFETKKAGVRAMCDAREKSYNDLNAFADNLNRKFMDDTRKTEHEMHAEVRKFMQTKPAYANVKPLEDFIHSVSGDMQILIDIFKLRESRALTSTSDHANYVEVQGMVCKYVNNEFDRLSELLDVIHKYHASVFETPSLFEQKMDQLSDFIVETFSLNFGKALEALFKLIFKWGSGGGSDDGKGNGKKSCEGNNNSGSTNENGQNNATTDQHGQNDKDNNNKDPNNNDKDNKDPKNNDKDNKDPNKDEHKDGPKKDNSYWEPTRDGVTIKKTPEQIGEWRYLYYVDKNDVRTFEVWKPNSTNISQKPATDPVIFRVTSDESDACKKKFIEELDNDKLVLSSVGGTEISGYPFPLFFKHKDKTDFVEGYGIGDSELKVVWTESDKYAIYSKNSDAPCSVIPDGAIVIKNNTTMTDGRCHIIYIDYSKSNKDGSIVYIDPKKPDDPIKLPISEITFALLSDAKLTPDCFTIDDNKTFSCKIPGTQNDIKWYYDEKNGVYTMDSK